MSAVPSRLRGEQLTLAYGNKTIAESLNVTIPDGHFTAIIGPNGCGKSTPLGPLRRLMNALHPQSPDDAGQRPRLARRRADPAVRQ